MCRICKKFYLIIIKEKTNKIYVVTGVGFVGLFVGCPISWDHVISFKNNSSFFCTGILK